MESKGLDDTLGMFRMIWICALSACEHARRNFFLLTQPIWSFVMLQVWFYKQQWMDTPSRETLLPESICKTLHFALTATPSLPPPPPTPRPPPPLPPPPHPTCHPGNEFCPLRVASLRMDTYIRPVNSFMLEWSLLGKEGRNFQLRNFDLTPNRHDKKSSDVEFKKCIWRETWVEYVARLISSYCIFTLDRQARVNSIAESATHSAGLHINSC